jgi:nicotinamide-nucleotide amidase
MGMKGRVMAAVEKRCTELADSISAILQRTHQTVSVAESLTSGALSSCLGATQNSSEWFLGSVVAYSSEVKFTVLGVDRGKVVTARCAGQMASGVARLLGSDLAVAVTGVGGPGPEEEEAEGTVYIAVYTQSGVHAQRYQFEGEPAEVLDKTIFQALHLLRAALTA